MTFSTQERDRTIALSAVIQAVHLVHNIAVSGKAHQDDVTTLLSSLLVTDADTTEDVYGGLSNLTTGIEQLRIQLVERKNTGQITQLQYAVNVIRLERQLEKYSPVMDVISRELDQLPQQIEYFGEINNPQVIARLADIYKKTVSNLIPIIEVHGEADYLESSANANLIRALLLAAIRAAVIWRQKGGRRWQFVFQAKKIIEVVEALEKSL